MKTRIIINKGDVFGNWKAIKEGPTSIYKDKDGKDYNKRTIYCLCIKCGVTKRNVNMSTLRSKKNRSCGCDQKNIVSKANTKHGLSKTPIDSVFKNMYQRCYNPKNTHYKSYGGRGIKICKEWLEGGLKVFADWAFTNGYDPSLQIDRKNNNKGYSPNNCRWVTGSDNANNKSTNVYTEHEGKKYTFSDFHKQYGKVKYATALYRFNVLKMDAFEAVTKEEIKRMGYIMKTIVKHKNKEYTFYDLWLKYGIVDVVTARRRFQKGMDAFEAVSKKSYDGVRLLDTIKYRKKRFYFSPDLVRKRRNEKDLA